MAIAENERNAELLLEKIFYYMNRLVDEREFSTTIQTLTEMGKTLVNADRASSGSGIRERESIGRSWPWIMQGSQFLKDGAS